MPINITLCKVRLFALLLITFDLLGQEQPAAFSGKLKRLSGEALPGYRLTIRSSEATKSTITADTGEFRFERFRPGAYVVVVDWQGKPLSSAEPLQLPSGKPAEVTVSDTGSVTVHFLDQTVASGGEDLGGRTVSSIPLNKRDFGQLLLLAAGTMTDTNGATNFTAQFAVNGQRGVETVFAMDGADSSDPEMGGATFSNFNVDAVAEIQSSSGWMPAEIGRGAAGFSNILTRSGSNTFHGSLFEFVRNSAFDARNFFDRRSAINPFRIPPFRRNEFGGTLGGPVTLPFYRGRDRTFFYLQYQGFRQVLGTTQVLPVPTVEERAGLNTTAFPGDTLVVPLDPQIRAALNRYPVPNNPTGPFGARTFAASSKVAINANQYSIRLDHRLNERNTVFARFSINNQQGPITNPNQTVIDPSFGILYGDRQRNGVVTWTHASPQWTNEASLSFTRTTPSFPTPNRADPAITFNDGLYEPFNAAGGSVMTSLANLFQGRETMSWNQKRHTIKAGGEFRANRDTSYYGTAPNGSYTYGGGTAYSTANIRSLSGAHNIAPGDPLPDTLTALLTGSAFAYSVAVAPLGFPQDSQIGVAAVSRYGLNLFLQDTWKITDRLQLEYGLRYELYTPFTERARRSAGVRFVERGGRLAQDYLINPSPTFSTFGNNWGPRVRLSWLGPKAVQVRVGAGLTTIPPNIWQDNLLTGSAPYVDYPRLTAALNAPLLYGTRITPEQLPRVYAPDGTDILASARNNSKAVPENTVWDISRFARDLAGLNPSRQVTPLNINAITQDFRNSYLATWTFALEKQFKGLTGNTTYVGTSGISLPAINFPNGYAGATAEFAPFTEFNSLGQPAGGIGTEQLMTNRSHSTYHGWQNSLSGTVPGGGPSLQASYTLAKSIDDVSTVSGGYVSGASGAIASAWPQNPFETKLEKAPSSFDVRHTLAMNAIQDIPLRRLPYLRALPKKVRDGWQLLNVITITSGSPFTIYSGIQQTGAGANGVDRPDQIGKPVLSTARTVREDYFGQGDNNASYFDIPVNRPGGTGPNSGYFGSLGRNTFRGPAYYNFDFGLIKDTSFGSRSRSEIANLQFRAEFFNLFNVVNFGLPANTILGSGFGRINRTAGTSRQIQFSLKLMF